MAPTLGAHPQIRDLPLVGVTAEIASRAPAITIAAGRDDGEQFTHIIHAPMRVQIERTNEGADVALQIESTDGTAAILRFKTPALPETVDGLPRQR
jgi:hypothetical protein